MFYVRTADRLQRTSTWRDNLEGGLDYLKDVVLNDSLGLAAELEAQMQQVVDTYQCEWKTAVTTPAVRQRFRSFVNSDSPTSTSSSCRSAARSARPDRKSVPAPPRGVHRSHRLTQEPRTMDTLVSDWTAVCAVDDILPTPASAPAWTGGTSPSSASVSTSSSPSTTWTRRPAPACSRAGWWATWASTWWWPRRSTSTTSTCAPASAWNRPSGRCAATRCGRRTAGCW
jgi:hypothetical protein